MVSFHKRVWFKWVKNNDNTSKLLLYVYILREVGDQELVLGPVLKITLLRWFIKQKHIRRMVPIFFFWLKNTLTLTGTDTDESYKIAFVG